MPLEKKHVSKPYSPILHVLNFKDKIQYASRIAQNRSFSCHWNQIETFPMKHLLTKVFYFKSMYLVSKMGSNIELSLSAPIDLSKTSSCCTMQCLSCLVRSEFFPKVGENFHCLWSLLRWLACQRWMLTVISMQPLHSVSFTNLLFVLSGHLQRRKVGVPPGV